MKPSAAPAAVDDPRRAALVLVVEDDSDISDAIALRLSRDGHLVRSVATKEAALAQIRLLVVDLVVLDLSLPDGSGLVVLAEIRSDPTLRGVPVLIVTSRDAPGDAEAGFEAGANAYLLKPFRAEDLAEAVRRLLAETRAARE